MTATQAVTFREKVTGDVVYSLTDDRADPEVMDDPTSPAALTVAEIFPYIDPSTGITSVNWWLDGTNYATRATAPYDLEGASGGTPNPFDLNGLTEGSHRLHGTITATDGRHEPFDLLFTVRRNPVVETYVTTTQFPAVTITVGGGAFNTTPLTFATATTFVVPTVTNGTTVNKARARIGMFPRIDGGYPANDDNLEDIIEGPGYLNKRLGEGHSVVKDFMSKVGWGQWLSSAAAQLDPTQDGLGRIRNRNPNPLELRLQVPIFVESTGYKNSFAAKRAVFQDCANGDFDSHFQDLVDICVQYGWGTTSQNLWLDTFHEFDAQGIQNPCGISKGNVDVAVLALIHVSRFFKQRLPRVQIGGGRISNGDSKYYLANGSDSGKTSLQALMQEWDLRGDPSSDIDMIYQNHYDTQVSFPSFHYTRADEVHAACVQYGVPKFGCSEAGLFHPDWTAGGRGDHPPFVQMLYDMMNNTARYPLHDGTVYQEGEAGCGLYPNSFNPAGFPQSLALARTLFGNP